MIRSKLIAFTIEPDAYVGEFFHITAHAWPFSPIKAGVYGPTAEAATERFWASIQALAGHAANPVVVPQDAENV